jgi:transcriptional regulator with XRE-family HTH domain
LPGHSDILSRADGYRVDDRHVAVEDRIRGYIELAIKRCGSAAALARQLKVKPPTVSQWRKGMKRPDAMKLVRIQDLARAHGQDDAALESQETQGKT